MSTSDQSIRGSFSDERVARRPALQCENNSNNSREEPYVEFSRRSRGRTKKKRDGQVGGDYDNINVFWSPACPIFGEISTQDAQGFSSSNSSSENPIPASSNAQLSQEQVISA